MLKALELVGFKSFADRTRFDFPDGITVVVGPNGSGKSNVVDAVKWVLGSQSAKALRGADMSDVIFKGSAEGGRKPANSTEVTLVLDNRSRLLTLDADEVQVSRRVYRSGEGEYTINGQPCRLKDVRDLFRGTGVGVDAYSLIEQGKVDRLLQSSPRDRRAIFEEAAGISRFKAKKAEAERRLGRVDQNMLRIRDIVEELGKRLSTLKSQASKAQRYREWTSQILVKRTQLGLLDVRELDSQTEHLDEKLTETESSRQSVADQLATCQSHLAQQHQQLTLLQQGLDELNERILEQQREHVQASSELLSVQQRQSEWHTERATLIDRMDLLERRVCVGEEEIQGRRRELTDLEVERDAIHQRILDIEAQVQQRERDFLEAKQSLAAKHTEHAALRDAISNIQVDASSHAHELERLAESIARLGQELDERSHLMVTLQSEKERVETELESNRQDFQAAEAFKTQTHQVHLEINERQRQKHQSLLEIQARIQGVDERLGLLSQLEEQFTNAGRGGQQLMRSAQSLASHNPALKSGTQSIRGLVADLITTDLHLAPLVDVALGTHSDAVVLADGQLVDWINEGRLVPEGRVTLLRMDRLPTRRTGEKIQLDGLRGIVGRADRLVRFDPVHEPLVRALLGTTWFVESLATALDLSHFRGAGLRFVTAECQLIDADGSITIGSLQTGLGLVSRRSEMQAAAEQREALQASLELARVELAAIDNELRAAGEAVRAAEEGVVSAARKMAAMEQRSQSIQQQLKIEHEATELRQLDLDQKVRLQVELQSAAQRLHAQKSELDQSELRAQGEIAHAVHALENHEALLKDAQASLVEKRIEQARLEQRLDGLRVTLDQLLQDASERANHLQIARDGLVQLMERIDGSHQTMEELQQRIAASEAALHATQSHRTEWVHRLETQQLQASETTKEHDQLHRHMDKCIDRAASFQQERERLVSKRAELLHRYRDDFRIDLELPESQHVLEEENLEPPESWNRLEIESQLSVLRQEIAAAGSVNMEALDELDELESRYNRLSGQEQDLLEAKSGLIKTMQKIDTDSQKLFLETLEAIRANFQLLYRKSFGGGSADIVLENPDDPESGIEILATPPGKTTFSNSLLSGGEKALTAVSLIMAFFQYRPSPFCILDEVDAPFDEANISRFVTVLNEFLDNTKFIVVTHSKKTMTAANMIYGITMQESGVSRQVAVKFEEVNDRGEVVRREHRRAA